MRDSASIKRLVLEKILVDVHRLLPARLWKGLDQDRLEWHVNRIASDMLIDLVSYVWAMPEKKLSIHKKWPATWWDAVKERWAPDWFLRLWPVAYEKIDIEEQLFGNICPHLRGLEEDHLRFLVAGETPVTSLPRLPDPPHPEPKSD